MFKNMGKEFREFAVKGNVVDLAVGVIIGAAFGKVVSSFVSDLVMPPVGLLVGGMDFSKLSLVLKEAAEGQAEVALRYGAFIQTLVDFLIVAWAIFIVVKMMNHLRQPPPPAAAAAPPADVQLLTEIRDLLRNK
jgi:large conductance mechanosensitive channel